MVLGWSHNKYPHAVTHDPCPTGPELWEWTIKSKYCSPQPAYICNCVIIVFFLLYLKDNAGKRDLEGDAYKCDLEEDAYKRDLEEDAYKRDQEAEDNKRNLDEDAYKRDFSVQEN